MDGVSELSPGTHIGPFEVQRLLKSGGMGRVYVARERATGASVAVKVLSATSTAAAMRFDRESLLAARLDHPNVVDGRGSGRTDTNLAWLAMELLQGEDLESRLARGPVAVSDAVDIAMQVCDALTYAHSLGVVHRDLKPSNLFLSEASSSRVKVLDFGIARIADDQSLTGTGVAVGTPAYMSPEQARGDRDIDLRTDLWSLGVVLYECLSGQKPFIAESYIGALFQILEVTPPRLDEFSADIPGPLADIVQQMLEKPRERRPASASAVRAALAVLSRSVVSTVPARPSTLPPEPDDITRWEGSADASVEVRLTSVVLLRGVRDAVFVDAVARELRGRVERLAGGGLLVLFGLDRWAGDEPRRALRLAQSVSRCTAAIGIATGRVMRGTMRVVGAAINVVSRLVERDGITLDAATAAVVRGEVALTQGPDGTAFVGAQTPPSSLTPLIYDTPFVGREGEVRALLRSAEVAWEELRPTGVAIVGPPGAGKSRLRHEAVERMAERMPDATCVQVRCDLFRRDTPFGALRDSFAQAVDPGVSGVFSPKVDGLGDPVAALDRVRASLSTLLQGLAERGPVVLVIDDAQWLDATSQATIKWLRETHPDFAMAVWLFGGPETAGIATLMGVAAATELGPLEPHEASLLLRAIAGEAPETVIERAGGHPLFLEELGRLMAHRPAGTNPADIALPVSVESAYMTQFDRMTPAEREFLKRAAVFGRTFWVEGVISLGGEGETVSRLRGTNLVVPRPRSRLVGAREMRFRASVLQEVAYELLPDGLRARMHGQAAEWMSARTGAAPDELARHWDLAGNDVRAAQEHVNAAEAAANIADTATTCAHTERALTSTRDPMLRWRALVARDRVLQLTDQIERRRQGIAELSELAAGLSLRCQTEAAWRRGYLARVTGDRAEILVAGRLALSLVEQLGDARWGATVHIDVAMFHADEGRPDDARSHATIARDLAARTDDPWLQARCAATLAYVVGAADDPAAGIELYALAASGFATAGDRRRESIVRLNAGWGMLRLGRVDEAESQTRSAIDASQRVGNSAALAAGLHNLGILRRVAGDLEQAASLQVQAEAISMKLRNMRVVSAAVTERVYLALTRGADDGAIANLAEEATRHAEATRSPALVASARAVTLRALARVGAVSPVEIAAARELAKSSVQADARAELLVAIWEVDGRSQADGDMVREAIGALADRVEAGSNRAACRDTYCRRYLVPEELSGR